jgi:hypothetical protein
MLVLPGEVLPRVEGTRLVSIVRLDKPEYLSGLVQHILREKIVEEQLSSAMMREMEFKVDCVLDHRSYSHTVRIAWCDPENRSLGTRSERRCLQIVVDDAADKLGLIHEVKAKLENISLRGEIYFFRLAKHFGGQLREVKCSKEGTVTVWFKNGMKAETPEEKLDSTEFLATCAMIYDIN